jgi:hypothetical protein
MSFHMKQELNEIHNRDCLLLALTTLNFNYDVHPEPVAVRGWQQEILSTRCEIVLARENTGLDADIGFHQEEDGTFTIVSDSFANSNMSSFMTELKRTYEQEQALALANELGFHLEARGDWVEIDGKRYQRMVVTQ